MLNIDQMIDDAKRKVKDAISVSVAKHMHAYFKGQLPVGVLSVTLETSPPPVVYVYSTFLAAPRHRFDTPLQQTLTVRCTFAHAEMNFYERMPTLALERLFVAGNWYVERIEPIGHSLRCVDVILYRVY